MASQTMAASMIPMEAIFRIEALPLNSGVKQFGPIDRALDQVRADAKGIGVVYGRHQGVPS